MMKFRKSIEAGEEIISVYHTVGSHEEKFLGFVKKCENVYSIDTKSPEGLILKQDFDNLRAAALVLFQYRGRPTKPWSYVI